MRRPDAVAPPKIVWNDALATGHPKIDEQHKSLFALASYLTYIEASEVSPSFIGEVLCQLADYAADHFGVEEELMRQSKYPRSAEHIVEHWNFLQQLSNFINSYERGGKNVISECREFLFGWLSGHISNDDQVFGRYLKGRNDCESSNISRSV